MDIKDNDNNDSEDRRIVRPKPHSPGTFATVVGLIPRLQVVSSEDNPVQGVQSKSGRIDSASGLSIVCLNYSNSTAAICIWENITCTLSENLHQQQKFSSFYHPEYSSKDNHLSPLTENMIALHPLGGGGEPLLTNSVAKQHQRLFYFSLYASSSNGVVCLWNDALLKTTSPITKADAVFRLPLEDDEVVTTVKSITSLDVILVGTSQGRIWIVSCRCSWPLQLEARQMLLLPPPGNRRKSTGVFTSLLGTIYSSYSTSATDSLNVSTNSSSSIINIFTLTPETRVDDILATSSSHLATPQRPSQRARLFRTPPQQSFLILRKNLELSKVTAYRNLTNDSIATMTTVLDGSTNLLNDLNAFFAQEWKQQYNSTKNTILRVKALYSACSIKMDCLFLVLRVSLDTHHRLYMVQFRLSQSEECFTASVIHGQWLNKYPSDIVPLLQCKGLDVVAEDGDEEQEGDAHDKTKAYLVYSTWQKQYMPHETAAETRQSLTLTALTAPATCTAIYFPSVYSSSTNVLYSIYDLELPRYAAPEVIGTGITPTSEGTLIMTEGKLISVVIKLDRKTPFSTENRRITVPPTSSPSSSLESPDVQTLIRHLSDAFHQYISNLSRQHSMMTTTDMSIATSLPPSLFEARPHALNIATDYVSLLLCNDSAKTSNVPLDLVKQKLVRHQAFVNFLNHAGLYRKLSSARRKLMDHGEMLQTCISLLELVNSNKNTLNHVDTQGLDITCTDVLSKLHLFQTQSVQKINGDASNDHLLTMFVIDNTSKTICSALESAQNYRMKYMDVLYDAPPKGCSGYVPPWTSRNQMKMILLTQLRLIATLGGDELNTDDAKTMIKHAVCVLGNALLQGYLDDDGCADTDAFEFAKQYHQAKVETIALFQLHLSSQEALDASLKHQYFEGIVKICEQEDKIFSDFFTGLLQKREAEPDLVLGQTFPVFVFSYFCEKGQFADILDLGLHCQAELQKFLEYEPRMHVCRWINNFRVGKFEDGAICLSQFFSLKTDNSSTSSNIATSRIIDNAVLMSLGKLADIASNS
jgi:hypothetical protein